MEKEIVSLSGLFDKELKEKQIDPEKYRNNFFEKHKIPSYIQLISEEKNLFFIDHSKTKKNLEYAFKLSFKDDKFFLYSYTRDEDQKYFNEFSLIDTKEIVISTFIKKYEYLAPFLFKIFNPANVLLSINPEYMNNNI